MTEGKKRGGPQRWWSPQLRVLHLQGGQVSNTPKEAAQIGPMENMSHL